MSGDSIIRAIRERDRQRARRRTTVQAAAERLVAALDVLSSADGIEHSDRVAFEDARAAVEKYRQE